MKFLLFAATATLVLQSQMLSGRERIAIHVSPSIASAPAAVRVRAMVEPDDANRAIEIVADSGDFFRRSLITLDGDRAPRVTEVAFKGLPGGEYEVAAVLHDREGRTTVARRQVTIVSAGADQ